MFPDTAPALFLSDPVRRLNHNATEAYAKVLRFVKILFSGSLLLPWWQGQGPVGSRERHG